MITDIQIQKMSAEDIPILAELEKECFSAPWSENSLLAETEKIDSHFFVLKSHGEIAGYIGSNIVLDECYIANVAVFKKFRGRGFGRLLVKTACENAVNHNCSFITLEVRPSNLPAVSLYSSFGFLECGRRKNFYSNSTEDCLIMTKYFTQNENSCN